MTVATTALPAPRTTLSAGAPSPGAELADAVLVVLHPLQGIGAGEQFPDRAAAGAGVRHDPRQLSGELDALLGQRHREHREQAAQHEEDQ